MTSENVSESERRENTPVPKETASGGNMNTHESVRNKETVGKSVRRKIAMFEVIGNTESAGYHFSQDKVNKELGNFKIESIRRNFHHEPIIPEMPKFLPLLEEPKVRKISDSFLVQRPIILPPCLTVDDKSVSNEEIAKTFSSEGGAIDVHGNNMFLQVQNDENSVSQTTLTSSTGAIEESTETHPATEHELDMESLEFDLANIIFDNDDTKLETPEEKMSTSFEIAKRSISDERKFQDGDCNVSIMTNGSSSTDGTYVSISVQVRSQLAAQNRLSDTSSGDYKYAAPPSIEPIYDRALTDRESSSSSNSAVVHRPTIVKILQKRNEKIKRPSSWHLGISESEYDSRRFGRKKRRNSLSICSTKSSVLDQGRDANSHPIIPATSSNNDSWSGSEFNNELNFSTASDSSRSHIYDADDDESDPYDRPHQLFSENPYDTPSPNRPRSETTNTITHLCESSNIDEIPEHSDVTGAEIDQLISPTILPAPESPEPPPIPARKLRESGSSCTDESPEARTSSLHSDSRESSLYHSMPEDQDVLRNVSLYQSEDRLNQRRIIYTTQISYNPPKRKEKGRTRKYSLSPSPVTYEMPEQEPKKVPKYKRMLFPFKRSTSVTMVSKQMEDVFASADFESSTSFEDITIEPTTPKKSSKGLGKKFMRMMKGPKKSEKSE